MKEITDKDRIDWLERSNACAFKYIDGDFERVAIGQIMLNKGYPKFFGITEKGIVESTDFLLFDSKRKAIDYCIFNSIRL